MMSLCNEWNWASTKSTMMMNDGKILKAWMMFYERTSQMNNEK